MGPLGILFAVLGGLAWLAIVAGIVLLIIWALRSYSMNPMRTAPAPVAAVESPLDMLSRRLAKGEITADEFVRARDLLRGEPPTP
jgi:uncharacterized membrane protein